MRPPSPDDPQAMRHAGRELLSVALIDARNVLLGLLAQDESAPALRLAAQAGWYAEYWIARHVQRGRGAACEVDAPRLAGIEPRIDAWRSDDGDVPSPEALRGYLAQSLEVTLDLLAAGAGERGGDDDALHFYRLALLHEDRLAETLAERLDRGAPPARVERPPIWWPGQRWQLGSAREGGGFVPCNERWAHEVVLPEFEIDAQPVNWARYAEFADDGGYDRAELWTPAGWAWAQAQARRAPRGVAQWRGGVLLQRGGGALQRAPAGQAAMHVSRHEAEAWCRWAGRRLPTEPEWELAASSGGSRGYVWGDVYEWVAGSARPWPGAGAADPGTPASMLPASGQGVLRGASFATRPRWRHPKARRFHPPGDDGAFCGFRSCAFVPLPSAR